MAIEAGRMVISAGNIEWLNFDFTKAMPAKERIIGVSSFSKQRLEGEDTLELDATYGPVDPEYEQLDNDQIYRKYASTTLIKYRGDTPSNAQRIWVGTDNFTESGSSGTYRENTVAPTAPRPTDPNTLGYGDNNWPYIYDEVKLFVRRLDDKGAAVRPIRFDEFDGSTPFGEKLLYISHTNIEGDPNQNQDLDETGVSLSNKGPFFRSRAEEGLPFLDFRIMRTTDFDDLENAGYYDPNQPVSLVELFDDDGKAYDPPRYKKTYNTFEANEDAATDATDEDRKVVSIAARGVALTRMQGGEKVPVRPDGELDSIWLVTCRIRTSPGGLTRSGSMLVVGSG